MSTASVFTCSYLHSVNSPDLRKISSLRTCMRVDPVDGLVRVELLVRTASQGVKIRGKMSAVPEGVDHIGKTEDSCDFTI